MNTIKENLEKIKTSLPKHVKLIVVSKTQSVETIFKAIEAGHNIFGENKVQELTLKAKELPPFVEWHMIGHLQTNKVKTLIPRVSLIHSLDSLKLAKEINKEAQKLNRHIPCLLQIHIATEETKYGLSFQEAEELIENQDFLSLQHLKIVGLMGMATFTENLFQIRKEFASLRKFFDKLKQSAFSNNPDFKELSMGMSNDYSIAIDEGSTMIRIGSLIFGERNYFTQLNKK